MPLFKVVSTSTGIILTLACVYFAQDKVKQSLAQNYQISTSENIAARLTTSFIVSVVVGGVVSRLIKNVYS